MHFFRFKLRNTILFQTNFWRFIGELWDAIIAKKSKHLPDFWEITIFKWQSVRKILHWKVSSLLSVKCVWVCWQKHKIECLSSIICGFIGYWKCDIVQKVRNSELKTHFFKSYIFCTMLWNTYILHKSENMDRKGTENFKIK